MKKRNGLMICLLLTGSFLVSCSKSGTGTGPVQTQPPPVIPDPVATEELIFNNGFEGTTMVSTGAQTAEFRGSDPALANRSNWVNDLANHPNVGIFRIYYEQGDSSQRLAAIVPDPAGGSNNVLNYKILAPHIDQTPYTAGGIVFDKKARIQADLYSNNNLKEIYQSVRLFLPADFNKLVNSKYPGAGDWITLYEFWNNAQWVTGATYPFRFGVNLVKGTSTAGSPLYFKTEGQRLENNGFNTVWQNVNTQVPVPIGKWMTIEYYIKEGNKGKGRFYFAITPDGGTKSVIFDITNETCHPDDPAPDGLTEINPLKLYTSNNIVNQMNAMGGVFQVYWDDFKFWKNKRP